MILNRLRKYCLEIQRCTLVIGANRLLYIYELGAGETQASRLSNVFRLVHACVGMIHDVLRRPGAVRHDMVPLLPIGGRERASPLSVPHHEAGHDPICCWASASHRAA